MVAASVALPWIGCGSEDSPPIPTGTGTTGGPGGTGGSGGSGGAGGPGGGGGAGGIGGGIGGSGGNVTCDAGEKDCEGQCVPVDDPQYGCSDTGCTPCDLPGAEALCTNGTCQIATCDAGFENCDGDDTTGCETDINGDPDNCAACGAACVTPHGDPLCNAGTCVIDACQAPYEDCDGAAQNGCETIVGSDPQHCAGCNMPCAAGEQCQGGVCGVFCDPGLANCDNDPQNGCETPLDTIDNCGFCGDACDLANAEAACVGGACQVDTCNAGYADCDGLADNGCETSIDGSALDCGACGVICPGGPHSTPVCVQGSCELACNGGFEDCDGIASTGCESAVTVDTQNCGTCGVVCTAPNGTPVCVAGQCDVSACAPGHADCNGAPGDGCEINTQTTVAHCGSCGNACPAIANGTSTCTGGTCGLTCQPGFADCNGNLADGCEVNLQGNTANCGACGTTCGIANGTSACTGGVCTVGACNPGFADCNGAVADGCETSTNTSLNDCGGCGLTCLTANGTPVCVGGSCQIGSCNPGAGDCNANPADGCEVNISGNANHCGACGTQCTVANGSPLCSNGTCQVGACAQGYANCDNNPANGCEIHVANNPGNCGACGATCTVANSTPACVGGTCQVGTCNAGYGDCDGSAATGCETNLQNNVASCGACGNTCTAANGTPACTNGACTIASCNAGWGNCDGNAANGCETNLQNSLGSCGTCGNACTAANGSPVCSSGTCGIASCNAGFGNCDGSTANGCETNLQNNLNNCGTCSTVCTAANGSPSCSGGACAVSSCNTGWGNCDGQVANGCETNLQNNLGNCGTCGNTCSTANGTAACTSGTCAVASCNGGFGNCDGQVANGCETNLQNNLNNCGTCGNVCSVSNGSPTCAGGGCGIAACNAGWGNCDGQTANGCETNLLSNTSHCGACGTACVMPNAVGACAAGGCVIAACNPGYADCDGLVANGCEVNTQTSTNHCGVCGNTCSAQNGTAACLSGACTVASCNPGFGNCDGVVANGCETNLQNSTGNCGTCGNACSAANGTPACTSGSCTVSSCNGGFQNCDGIASNGCEVNINTNAANCGGCGNACTSVCAGNVSATTCSAGSCDITACSGSYQNVDGICTTGCECLSSNVSATCSLPASLGTVNVGGQTTTSSNLVPAGKENWYVINFTGNTNANYHPRVRFTSNPGNAFRFDVRTNCAGGTMACGVEGGVSNGLTDWETYHPAANGFNQPVPPAGNNGQVLIRVYRVAGAPVNCTDFTLAISN
ncbi:Hypothetical protein CAP_2185 [Chondromyces apiculatus DSM 436]|uniref:Tryptophan synthase alpha chain n=1 Tax=Chondromyces apiculatus DSM 436 TaxID=1192034 RepID=A0A017TBK7_9BACT|nr:Hypothetical protein CAP_2185 [Chondromyces apiculatus DSM 436]